MGRDSKAFDLFGEKLIPLVRDHEIAVWEHLLQHGSTAESYHRNEKFFQSLNPEQREDALNLITEIVDHTIHNFLLFLEQENWIKVSLETEDDVVDDIRTVARGDLQGYASIWAEQHSKKPLTD